MPSKSIVVTTFAGAGFFVAVGAGVATGFGSSLGSGAFFAVSSSLCGLTGDSRSRRKTAAYTELLTGCSSLVMSSP